MNKVKIPETTITRLSSYLRIIEKIKEEGTRYTSSLILGERVGLNSDQVRKDLAYFGQFGIRGQGYAVDNLEENLKKILGLNRPWRVAVIGTGNLGSALMAYKGFAKRGFRIVAAFDIDKRKVGRQKGTLTIKDFRDFKKIAETVKIDIGIVAVPEESAIEVINCLTSSGIKAILNFAPLKVSMVKGTKCRNVDLSTELEGLTYFLSSPGI